MSNLVGNSTFIITDAKLYVSVVTLSTEDNAKLSKLLTEGFKRPVYWTKYKIVPNKTYDENDNIRELLDSSYQGVKRFNRVKADSHRGYFLPRIKMENYNIETDGRNFYDHSINDSIKQYDEVSKVSTGEGDDYATGCLLDFAYFEKNLQANCG